MHRPTSPRGHHILQLRTYLNLSQTDFGSLLRMAQSTVSQWETQRRDDVLPPELADRILDAWDCFARRPPTSPAEASALLAEYHRLKAALPGPMVTDAQPPTPVAQSWPIHLARGPLAPGTRLIETGPLVPGSEELALTRTFAAVPAETTPHHSENRVDATAAEVPDASRKAPKNRPDDGSRDAGRLTFALVLTVLVFSFTAGCMLSHRGSAPDELVPMPNQVYTENGAPHEQGRSRTASGHSIPMPEKPYSWQKLAPCDTRSGEAEKIGACWMPTEAPIPCPNYLVEDAGKCLLPVPAPPKPPSKPISCAP